MCETSLYSSVLIVNLQAKSYFGSLIAGIVQVIALVSYVLGELASSLSNHYLTHLLSLLSRGNGDFAIWGPNGTAWRG